MLVRSYLPLREGLILEDGSDVQSRKICNYQEMLPNIPEDGRPQALGCAWHFVTCYEYNFATWRTNPLSIRDSAFRLFAAAFPQSATWYAMSRPTAVGSCTAFCPAVHDFPDFIVRCWWCSHYHGTQSWRRIIFCTATLRMLGRCAVPTQFLLSVFCIYVSLGTADAVQHWLSFCSSAITAC